MNLSSNFKDFLIVGFGISGLAIAKHLYDKKMSFDVIADLQPKASLVSGGLLNPVALKRLKLAWNAQFFHEYAVDFYSNFTQLLNKTYLKNTSIFRIFSSTEEQNQWFSTSKDNLITNYLSKDLTFLEGIKNPYKSSEVLHSYLLNLTELIFDFADLLEQKSSFYKELFVFEELDVHLKNFIYGSKTYKNIIFTDGFSVQLNPFFNYLPIYGNKGDYLIVKCPELSPDKVYKAAKFLIPIGNHMFKYGATYERNFNHEQPSDDARKKLTEELDELLEMDYQIIDQVSGIRPTTNDRMPVSGCHPKIKNLFILNGMGSRGILSSPWLAKNLIESIIQDKSLHSETNVARFTKKYF